MKTNNKAKTDGPEFAKWMEARAALHHDGSGGCHLTKPRYLTQNLSPAKCCRYAFPLPIITAKIKKTKNGWSEMQSLGVAVCLFAFANILAQKAGESGHSNQGSSHVLESQI